MKVYLDACCLGRLTDDQRQPRILEEAESIERVLMGIRRGKLDLVSSEALEDEAMRNPSMERRIEAEAFLSLASSIVQIDDAMVIRAQDLAHKGYGAFDSIHLAAAEAAKVDVLLSTDDHFVKLAARGIGRPRIQVRNPVSWIKEQGL